MAHKGHQGLVKTKALIREYAWFPNMDKVVKDELEMCLPCQITGPVNAPEPLQTPEMPDGPWQTIHADFYGPLLTGQYIIVLIDKYSRYPEAEIVKSTSASTIIPKVDAIFARHGVPCKFKSDNGPPFNSKDFSHYLAQLGVKHETSTPEWPQGNAEAEAFMKPLGKAIKTARAEHRNWVQELSRFLLSYRTTPHRSTNVPPAQLLFNRPVRGALPMLNPKDKVVNRHNEAKQNDIKSKNKGREYADKRRHAQPSQLRVGDVVILKQKKKNKFTTRFESIPYTVIERKGTKIVAENQRHRVVRNASFFKRIKDTVTESDDEQYSVSENKTPEEEKNKDVPEPAVRRSTRRRMERELYGNPINSDVVIK